VWSDVGLDFIEALPHVGGKSVILTVVDRFSKYCHFIPLAHPYSAESVAQAFFTEIVRLHGIPQSIGVHLGRAWWAGPKHGKKARPRHGTTRNNLVPGRHGPLYRAGFGPRSRPMGGHEHDPFKAGTKWPI
jgi:hypothetical protein